MTRTEVVQRAIDATNATSYLEIGVERGWNFFPLRCAAKTAVDPSFLIPRFRRHPFLNKFRNSKCSFFEVESNEFFRSHLQQGQQFDVAFIDGLHTFQQSLTDLRNCLSVLTSGGIAVMHDCSPAHFAAAFPANSFREAEQAKPRGWNGEWCGDVWKTIRHVKANSSGLECCVLDCDHGVGIVVKTAEDWSIEEDTTEVVSLTFEDLDRDRQAMINLKPPAYVDEFLKQWKRPS